MYLPITTMRLVCRSSILNVIDAMNCMIPMPISDPAIISGPNEHDTKA